MAKQKLFDDEFLKKLEYLYLVSKKVFKGRTQALSRSKKHGWGMEFADHRDYNPGDDLRYLDWNLFGRMEQLVTKLFHEEENLNVYFLIDCSKSMEQGNPSKFDYARKIVAALAYVTLANLDTVHILPFGADLASNTMTHLRGKGQILNIFEYLEKLNFSDGTDMKSACRTFCARGWDSGLVVVVSDFFDEAGFEKPLKTLFFAKHDLSAICVHETTEARPDYRGAVRFTDSETGDIQMINISPRMLKRYQKEYEKFCQELQETCHAIKCTYLHTVTDIPFEDLILNIFRQGRFVK